MKQVFWNPTVKFILSDVDETVADLYSVCELAMIHELTELLQEGKTIFFITGQSLTSVKWRIVDYLPQEVRHRVLIAPCSGAEVWGHNKAGNLNIEPFYSLYEEKMSEKQKKRWRAIIQQLLSEFQLKTYSTMPVAYFLKKAGTDPLCIMFEDRGSQITFELVNAYDLSPGQVELLRHDIPKTHGAYDLRIPIIQRAQNLLKDANLPISPRLGGVFAIDFVVEGVSKATAVKFVLENRDMLNSIEVDMVDLVHQRHLEIWGDKFSVIRGGSDRHICEAVNPKVRAIDFRKDEKPNEFLPGYNIVLWTGKKSLHHGLLEYLQSRHGDLGNIRHD